MTTHEGTLTPPSGRLAIVAARFNQFIVQKLVDGAREGLLSHGMKEESIDLIWVPGSFEIPAVAKRLAESKKYAAVICLGAVIKGETDHYEYVAGNAASGVAQVALSAGVPVIFGILTCQTVEQAMDRTGGKAGNKGFDAALAALEMANLLAKLP
jgi:6,7-dimethyl-8-ribityllumazine synthase